VLFMPEEEEGEKLVSLVLRDRAATNLASSPTKTSGRTHADGSSTHADRGTLLPSSTKGRITIKERCLDCK
jgi:hypothetical protein